MTPARIEVMQEHWPKNTPTRDVERMLNELPGNPIPYEQIAIYAAKLGLKRPPRVVAA